jgi:uncharacterized delta-60 repeat protein
MENMNKMIVTLIAIPVFVARGALDTSVGLDASFDPGGGARGGFIESTAIGPDGKILICGNFTSYNGDPRAYLCRLERNGSIDLSFRSHASYWVRTMSIQKDGKIVIGGFFTRVQEEPRQCIARLLPNGSFDTNFIVGTGCEGKIVPADPTDPFVFATAIQEDGKILIGGNFTSYNGVPRNGLARLESDGSLDTNFVIGSGMDSWVRTLLIETNGDIMAGGWFQNYNNRPANRLVRIHPDGEIDMGFSAHFGEQTALYSIARVGDGKYIVSGHALPADSPFSAKILRLNHDGSVDSSFNRDGRGANDKVESVWIDANGRIIIVGYFSLFNGLRAHRIARLNPDGDLDTTFGVDIDDWTWTARGDVEGKILISGGFASVNGYSRNGIARLSPLSSLELIRPRFFEGVFTTYAETKSGKTYNLQFKNTLKDTVWGSLAPVEGDGTVKAFYDASATTSSIPSRVYRIVEQ